MTHSEFNQQLVEELKREPIFRRFWADGLNNLLTGPLALRYESQEYVGYYKYEQILTLYPLDGNVVPGSERAELLVVFTSAQGSIDLADLLMASARGSSAPVCGVTVFVRLYDADNYALARFSKTLWSQKPARLEGDSGHVELLLK